MHAKPSLKEFLSVVGKGWGDKVSGRFSVPFTLILNFIAGYNFFTDTSLPNKLFWGVLGVFAILYTSFEVWSKERVTVRNLEEQLESKLDIDFEQTDEYFKKVEEPNLQINTYVRVLPRVSEPVRYCKGFLVGLLRFDNGEWKHTELKETVTLIWANPGEAERTLYPNQKQFLQVIRSNDGGRVDFASWDIPRIENNILTYNGRYKLDIEIRGENHVSKIISLEYESGGSWDRPNVKKVV